VSAAIDTVGVVERFMAAMSTLDTVAMLAEVADDVVVRLPAAPPGLPREAVGKSAFAEFLAGVGLLWTSWSMPRCAVHALADDPDRAVVEYASDSVNSDGSPYRNTYLSMATVRGGRLVEFVEFFDTEQVARAVAALAATRGATA
jgi:ketosteroid isomerase-like protein